MQQADEDREQYTGHLVILIILCTQKSCFICKSKVLNYNVFDGGIYQLCRVHTVACFAGSESK